MLTNLFSFNDIVHFQPRLRGFRIDIFCRCCRRRRCRLSGILTTFPLELGFHLIVCWYQLKKQCPQPFFDLQGQRSRSPSPKGQKRLLARYLKNGWSDLSVNWATDAHGHGHQLINFWVLSSINLFFQNFLKNAFFTKSRFSVKNEWNLISQWSFDVIECTKPQLVLNVDI